MKPEIIHPILIAATIIIIGLITALVTRKRSCCGKGRFDERQLLAQGQANRCAYYTLMLSLTAYIIYARFAEKPVLELGSAAIVCICISVVVMAVISIMKDAYVAYNDKISSRAILIGVLGVCNLFNGINGIIDGTAIQDGTFGVSAFSLLVAAMSLVIVVAMLIRGAVQKRENALEESDDE